MKILVLGGTIFVGRLIVEAAVKRGHEVTLFNRGLTNSELFPDTEKLRGDRTKNLSVIKGRSWDCIVDVSGYLPRVVRKSAESLSEACQRYIYISTGSVYSNQKKVGLSEEDAIQVPANPEAEEVTDEAYGELKAGCETVVQSVFGVRSLIIRAGLVVGPLDPTDRFTYWPVRVASGGTVLAPGEPNRRLQFIDGRDLASWIVFLIESRAAGIYNATGPNYPLNWGQFLSECKSVSGSDAKMQWMDDDTLIDLGLNRWTELPMWIPQNSEYSGAGARDNRKAIGAGLRFRPLQETIADTLKWWHEERQNTALECGLSREREAELLRT